MSTDLTPLNPDAPKRRRAPRKKKGVTVEQQRAARIEKHRNREESRAREIEAKKADLELEARRIGLQERELALRESEAARLREAGEKAGETATSLGRSELVAKLQFCLAISDKPSEIVSAGKFLAQLQGWITPEQGDAPPAAADPTIAGLMRGAADSHGVEAMLKAAGINLDEEVERRVSERLKCLAPNLDPFIDGLILQPDVE